MNRDSERQASCMDARCSEIPSVFLGGKLEAETAEWRETGNAYSRPMPDIGEQCHELRIVDVKCDVAHPTVTHVRCSGLSNRVPAGLQRPGEMEQRFLRAFLDVPASVFFGIVEFPRAPERLDPVDNWIAL